MSVDFIIISMRREDTPASFGRQKALRTVKEGLPGIGCRPHWVTLRQPRNRLWALAIGITRWTWRALSGRVLPLQSILALQGRVGPLPSGLASCVNGHADARSAVVYVDTVRLAHCGEAIRSETGSRLVIDFDDLLSRRIARMMRRREELSFGAFSALVPSAVSGLIGRLGPLKAKLLSLEKYLVRRAEIRAAETADALVFASPYEAKLFQRFLRRHASNAKPRYLILGHIFKPTDSPGTITRRLPPDGLRFIFIGSDLIEQNRVAIQAIVDLANEGALAVPAFIYGRMTRSYGPSGNAVFCGFAESLSLVYQPGSILLLAQSVRGGIKSKVLEAFEHNIPTIGTDSALEGFEGSYPWRLDDVSLRRIVANESELRRSYQKAVAAGVEICARQFSSQRHWDELKDYVDGRCVGAMMRPRSWERLFSPESPQPVRENECVL